MEIVLVWVMYWVSTKGYNTIYVLGIEPYSNSWFKVDNHKNVANSYIIKGEYYEYLNLVLN